MESSIPSFGQRFCFTQRLLTVTYKRKSFRWTPLYRLQVALANNNGGQWWLCEATRSVADIERRFVEGSVARNLYDVVGGILGNHKHLKEACSNHHFLYVQLKTRDPLIDLGLQELGLTAIDQTNFSNIESF